MGEPTLSLVIPLYNEEKNLPALVDMLRAAGLANRGVSEVILVDNGAKDGTGALADRLAPTLPGARVLHLPVNREYGGGVYAGLVETRNPFVSFVPGDLQVDAEDLLSVWAAYREWLGAGRGERALFKGKRLTRLDPLQTKFVSWCYTGIANAVLGTKVADFNGLPKMFHRSLLEQLPRERMTSFTFDAQLLLLATRLGWPIREVPVKFLARREGVSSWSGKRIQVYRRTFKELFRLREIHRETSP